MTTLDEYTQAVQDHVRQASTPQVVEMQRVADLNLLPPSRALGERSIKAISTGQRRSAAQLDDMIGLGNVKKAVASITNQMRFDRQRLALDLPVAHQTQHFVFTGNPGTGKTTVARILGKIMYEEGYLTSGHVIECNAQHMISQYVGGTAPMVMACVQRALGGVLFIDEAYGLLDHVGKKSSFTEEAIAALLGAMENYRDQFSVVAAGYPAEMLRFIDSNPGLKSRFTRFVAFDDYDEAELEEIFVKMADALCYKIDPVAHTSLKWVMERGLMLYARNFSNGRFVRNLFESTIRHMANRLETRLDHGADLTRSDMTVIMGCDVDAAWNEMLHMPK